MTRPLRKNERWRMPEHVSTWTNTVCVASGDLIKLGSVEDRPLGPRVTCSECSAILYPKERARLRAGAVMP